MRDAQVMRAASPLVAFGIRVVTPIGVDVHAGRRFGTEVCRCGSS